MASKQKFRTIRWLLLLMIPFNLISYLALKEIHQYQIQSLLREIEHFKPKVILCLDEQEFKTLNWIEKNEFILNNQWFDVIKIKHFTDGSKQLWVYKDDQESAILCLNKGSENSNHSAPRFPFIQNLFSPVEFRTPDMEFARSRFPDHILPIYWRLQTIWVPPPNTNPLHFT